MGFPDFPISERDGSYLSQAEILDFLNTYANHFKLKELIRFDQMVTEIRPFEDKWRIKSLHRISKHESVDIYDVVMICNGHYNTPIIPNLPGQELFQGKILHSHHYRSAKSEGFDVSKEELAKLVQGFENKTSSRRPASP
jgi:dimethylaniline monooxygenase (N-oxide forming)